MSRILPTGITAILLFIQGCVMLSPGDPSAYLSTAETGLYKQVAFDQSGAYLAAHDILRGRLDIYSTRDLHRIASHKLKMWQTNSLQFSPDGSYLAIDSERQDTIEIWRIGSNETVASLHCGKSRILAHAFSAQTDSFAALCADGTLRRWETRSWQPIATDPAPRFWSELKISKFTPVSFSPKGDILVIPGDRILLWNVDTRETSSSPALCKVFVVFATDPGLKNIAVACQDDWGMVIKAWYLANGQEIALQQAEFAVMRYLVSADFDHAPSMAFSPDGRYLAATLTASGPIRRTSEIRLWDITTGKLLWTRPAYEPADAGPPVAFSPDGEMLVTGGNRVQLFKVRSLLKTTSQQPSAN